MDIAPCSGLVINAPDIFADPDFQRWLLGERPKFTWHRGGVLDEWSDVVVLVDPTLNGEGSDSDMPLHIWTRIVSVCIDHFGPIGTGSHHIMVRLTNLAV